MAYTVNFSQSTQTIAVRLSTGGMLKATFGTVQYVNTGKQGIDGTTFYPSVEGEDCTLSWTNDGAKKTPHRSICAASRGLRGYLALMPMWCRSQILSLKKYLYRRETTNVNRKRKENT